MFVFQVFVPIPAAQDAQDVLPQFYLQMLSASLNLALQLDVCKAQKLPHVQEKQTCTPWLPLGGSASEPVFPVAGNNNTQLGDPSMSPPYRQKELILSEGLVELGTRIRFGHSLHRLTLKNRPEGPLPTTGPEKQKATQRVRNRCT